MAPKYSKEAILTQVEQAAETMRKFYQAPFVNYAGIILGGAEYDTEVVAKYLLDHPQLWEQIPVITRTASYRVEGHEEICKNPNSNQKEAHLAYDLFERSQIVGLGTVLDYQVPLKDKLHDDAGKIDLIAEDGTSLYLLELKKKGNDETLLRCVLEILTYWHVVDRRKLVSDFLGASVSRTVAPAVLLPEGCRAYRELAELRQGKRPQLAALMEQHGVQAFELDDAWNCRRG